MNVIDPEQARLQDLEGRIEGWQKWILSAASGDSVDKAILDRFKSTTDRLTNLNDDLHEEDFDPAALAQLRGLIIHLIGTVNQFEEEDAYDALDDALVTLEAMRHIIRDALDWHVTGVGEDSTAVVHQLYDALPSVRKTDIAELVDVTPRHLQRLAKEPGNAPRRLELVARLIRLLQRGWTEEGIMAWFHRPRIDLGGTAPFELLDDPTAEHTLLIAAKQGRAQHGV